MKKRLGRFYRYYNVLREINDRVFGVVASILFGFIYIVILPFFAIFSKTIHPPEKKSNWHPWSLKSDTLEELRRQY